MKLVADVDTITANLSPLTTTIEDYSSAVSAYDGASINCSLEEVSGILDSYKKSISEDLNKINTSSNEYNELVKDCCNEYKANEGKTQSVSIDFIDNIVKGSPELFTDYKGDAATKLTGLPTTDFGFKVCEAKYAPSDKAGLFGVFTASNGKEFEIYNQTGIYNNQGSWGVSWNANDKCTRCSVASLVSGYSKEGGRAALNRNALWGDNSMINTINECSNGKLSAKYTDYSSSKIKEITSNGGYALVYVTNSPAKSGMRWAVSQHAMTLLDYRETDHGGQVFVSTSGTQPNSSKNLWVDVDEFDHVMKSNRIIEVTENK